MTLLSLVLTHFAPNVSKINVKLTLRDLAPGPSTGLTVQLTVMSNVLLPHYIYLVSLCPLLSVFGTFSIVRLLKVLLDKLQLSS